MLMFAAVDSWVHAAVLAAAAALLAAIGASRLRRRPRPPAPASVAELQKRRAAVCVACFTIPCRCGAKDAAARFIRTNLDSKMGAKWI